MKPRRKVKLEESSHLTYNTRLLRHVPSCSSSAPDPHLTAASHLANIIVKRPDIQGFAAPQLSFDPTPPRLHPQFKVRLPLPSDLHPTTSVRGWGKTFTPTLS